MAPRSTPAPAPEPTPDAPTPDKPAPDVQAPAAATPDAAAPEVVGDDIPVFAPAEEPTPDTTVEPVINIPEWLADNYREVIADPARGDSFTKLAERSEGDLAAWARREAALAGEETTPVDATSGQPAATREGAEQ